MVLQKIYPSRETVSLKGKEINTFSLCWSGGAVGSGSSPGHCHQQKTVRDKGNSYTLIPAQEFVL
jgi:hypothetical protein